MTTEAFIDICERSFSEQKVRLGPNQREIYAEKLRRFTNDELNAIFDKVLETTRNFPKIRDIYDAARDCGFLQTEMPQFRSHDWKESACNLCHGEGRLLVIWQLAYEENGWEEHRLKVIRPYSAPEIETGAHDFRTLFRCQCSAGDASTIPAGWPKWSTVIEPVRKVRA
jgi:hypothetical protein